MTTFLGVPIVIDGQAWGNLYLTEKEDGGEFTDEDEEAAVVLADWAAIAIGNARLYRTVRERRDELERTIRGLETTTEISRALGGVTDLDRVLELVVKRSRALIDARAAEIALLDGDEFVIAAVAGEGVGGLKGMRMPVAESLAAAALRTGRQQRFDTVPTDSFAARELGARTAIVTPMSFRNRPVGFLVVFDRLDERPAVQRGGRAAAAGLRGERGDRGRDRAERERGGAAAQHRGLRVRAHALGARAARRDAAAARRAARAALGRAPQRRRRSA